MGAGASSDESNTSRFIAVQPTTTDESQPGRNSFSPPRNRRPPPATAPTLAASPVKSRNNDGYSRNQDELALAKSAQIKQKQQQQKFHEDDVVFETFYHKNEKVYTCLYRGGMRYFLDSWDTQEWQEFPLNWYNEGILVTDTLVRGEQVYGSTSPTGSGGSTDARTRAVAASQSTTSAAREQKDDREGTIDHPKKGKLQTYIFEEKRNIHCFYDDNAGRWVKLPINWELNSSASRKYVDEVQQILPDWFDRHDILGALRASNYDIYDCVDNHLIQVEAGEWITPRSVKGEDAKVLAGKEKRILELEKELKAVKNKLEEMKRQNHEDNKEKDDYKKRSEEYEDRVTSLEAENRSAMIQLEAVQMARPKTAASRPKTPAPVVQTVVVEKNRIEPETLEALQNNSIELYKIYNTLRLSVEQMNSELGQYVIQANSSLKKMTSIEADTQSEVIELRNLYRKEATQRKLLYNKLQELRGNIRVFCRCRLDKRTECCLQFPDDQGVVAFPGGSKKMFKFDKVFPPDTSQTKVFEDTSPIITSCVDGYNVCILAYGQTGSGKTHTMIGPEDDPGVNIRSIKELLKTCSERETIQYKIQCSMVEIYNEMVHDLLSTEVKQLDIRVKGRNLDIPNMIEMEVQSAEDIQTIIELGDQNRAVASTKMNSQSSRSHLIMMIKVKGHDKVSNAVTTGVLTLCDLAGSERVSKSDAEGQRLVEAAAINKSLSALGQVFTALRTNQLHVPYRNSKLTHILQPCLGGDAKACLFVAVSPDESNLQETTSTLQFGSNARQVALGQAKQNIKKPNN